MVPASPLDPMLGVYVGVLSATGSRRVEAGNLASSPAPGFKGLEGSIYAQIGRSMGPEESDSDPPNHRIGPKRVTNGVTFLWGVGVAGRSQRASARIRLRT